MSRGRATRTVLNALRAIPELVWASTLLIAAGLGPFAGTLALVAHTTGVLGRLFSDAFEDSLPSHEFVLCINGASSMAAFFYAIVPQLLCYTLYRWENNIRAAAILGVVGAAGIVTDAEVSSVTIPDAIGRHRDHAATDGYSGVYGELCVAQDHGSFLNQAHAQQSEPFFLGF